VRFYRVSYSQQGGNSGGYSWHTNKADAVLAAAEAVSDDPQEYTDTGIRPRIEPFDITPTKDGILEALKIFASHPDNG
jgi:hypothetical protein